MGHQNTWFWFIFSSIDFMISGRFRVFSSEETASHPRFWIRALKVQIRHTFVNILEILRKWNDWNHLFYEVSWCEAISSRGQVSEIRGSSNSWGRDPFLQVPVVKMCPHQEFSIGITMMFDVNSDYVHPRFWIRALQVEIRHPCVTILRI